MDGCVKRFAGIVCLLRKGVLIFKIPAKGMSMLFIQIILPVFLIVLSGFVLEKKAKLDFPYDESVAFDVVEEAEGNATTAFGAPDVRFEADHRRTTATDGERLATLVAASYAILDAVVARAPATLRKGPRGGGRDRDKIVEHVVGADGGYARVMGLKGTGVDPRDSHAVAGLRTRMIDVIRAPSDGSPLGARKWPVRYAARRVAWHALDHAWEIEDRSDPAG